MSGSDVRPFRFKLLPGTIEGAEAAELPLVSIVLFVRNRAATLRRAIESVLSQNYPRIQLVVQDAASTDGTLEILQSYGSRIDLVSEPDAGVHDGFWRALQRVKGEIIGTCLSDEQLTPGAIRRGVNELLAAPEVGAITGDAYMSDYSGRVFHTVIGQDFDLLAYLIGDYCPHFSATFFRRAAIEEVGLFDSPWREGRKEPVEFEIWCRLGTQHSVKYVPHFFYKFGYDVGQLSHNTDRIIEELDRRTLLLEAYLFGRDNFFGEHPALFRFIVRRQHEIIVNHLISNDDAHGARKVEIRMCEVLGLAPPPPMPTPQPTVAEPPKLPPVPRRTAAWSLRKLTARFRNRASRFARRHLTAEQRSRLRRIVKTFSERAGSISVAPSMPRVGIAEPPPVPIDIFRGQMYEYTAKCYRGRGMLPEALQMYGKAETLGDSLIDAEAYQLAIASPDYTDADLEILARRWSFKHMAPDYNVVYGRFANLRSKRRITIGYHCIFWGSACADALALPFISQHDRTKFRIIGYSPFEESARVQQYFDQFHGATENYDSGTFATLVRSDEVDIFVELSGLSPYHRFGAMALRCAPIQVNYVNHLATTQVANVDYLIGDEITFPKEADLYYSEKIYRLPTCLLAYNYDTAKMPEVSPPPLLENGYVTFGSFGGPFKFNRECLQLWAAVLRAVPKSRILLQNDGMSKKSNRDFIRRQFEKYGVDADRVIILPGTSRDDNLLNYDKLDISLDSWPYCGGNSIAEALWQGVPVVTLKGPRATSAYGASLVTAAGLAEFVAETPQGYVDIAARLADDVAKLVSLRGEMRSRMHSYGLADPERLARAIEAAFVEMVRRREDPLAKSEALAIR